MEFYDIGKLGDCKTQFGGIGLVKIDLQDLATYQETIGFIDNSDQMPSNTTYLIFPVVDLHNNL